jgi:outer membrane lipoprotein-sorting protein
MNTKRTALAVAATGTAAGVVGLVVLAMPASAGSPPPPLPPISAEALVQSVMNHQQIPAFSGTVSVTENLGLPIPILPSGGRDGVAARIYTDGTGKARIQLTKQMSETTIVEDGTTTWIWDSADKTVRKVPHGDLKSEHATEQLADPANAAKDIVSAIQEDSTVSVDGTAMVAGRSAYQLVLTPKPTEKTLLREIRVAVDSETRLPLRLEVLANGQADPALRIAFTEFSPGAQDGALFQFSPPAGAKVTESKPGEKIDPKAAKDLLTQINPQFVGKGWDTVVVGKVPTDLLNKAAQGSGQGNRGNVDVNALLRQFAKQVNGSFGTGWVISTKVGSLLFTADGRAALGAVPEQVLIDAIGQVK